MLAARAGPKQMASAAVVGGVLLALIEGMGILFTRMMAPPVPTAEDFARDVTAPPTAGGLFPGGGSPFGGGVEQRRHRHHRRPSLLCRRP